MLDLLLSYFNFLIILSSYIIKRLTFRKPKQPGYIVNKKDKKSKMDIYFLVENDTKVKYQKKNLKGVELEYINLHKNNKTITDLLLIKPYRHFPICIIYCHGNCGDIGHSLYDCYSLAKKTNCIVLSFEYQSYGSCKEVPISEKTVYNTIQNIYIYAKSNLKFHSKNIFLYGFSLGTGIVFDLACRKEFPIGGIILQSPYLSIFRVIYDINKSPFFDILKNCEKAYKLKAPALFIHGNSDNIIPYIHGRILAKLIPKKYFYDFYTVKEGDHLNLFVIDEENIYHKIREFISHFSGIDIENLIKKDLKLDTLQNSFNNKKEKDNDNDKKDIRKNDEISIIDELSIIEETKSQCTLDKTLEKKEVKNNKIINSIKNKVLNSSHTKNDSYTTLASKNISNINESSNMESFSYITEQHNINNQLINDIINENIYENNNKEKINNHNKKKMPIFNLKSFSVTNKSLKHFNSIIIKVPLKK